MPNKNGTGPNGLGQNCDNVARQGRRQRGKGRRQGQGRGQNRGQGSRNRGR